ATTKYSVFCQSPFGLVAIRTNMLTTTAAAKGKARRMTVGRKRPLTFAGSGSSIVANDGQASIIKSMSVTWIGMNGNGMFISTQMSDTATEYSVLIKKMPATRVTLLTTRLPSSSTEGSE